MGFYRDWYDRLKVYTEAAPVEAILVNSTENLKELRVTYQSMKSLRDFLDWLQQKAIEEDATPEAKINASTFLTMGNRGLP